MSKLAEEIDGILAESLGLVEHMDQVEASPLGEDTARSVYNAMSFIDDAKKDVARAMEHLKILQKTTDGSARSHMHKLRASVDDAVMTLDAVRSALKTYR
jgi:histidyl-tRNA synthetase